MSISFRRQRTLAVVISVFLLAPLTVLANGKKHFKEGMNYQQNKQWDKAASAFALAVADNPGNIEYQLHYQRALVNSGIMLVERGDSFADQKDYKSAYQAYRQAYAFDPTNELAVIKMRRMLEMQNLPTDSLPGRGTGSFLKPRRPNTLQTSLVPTAGAAQGPVRIPPYKIPRQVMYRQTSLQAAIESLANAMNLNVIFDQTANQVRMPNQNNFSVHLNDVTPARALELILMSNGLMYAQVDKRTIIVASDAANNRQKYEPVSIRTFYIRNADANEVMTIVKTALTPVGGASRQQLVLSKQLNALIVRDTPANLELIESIIDSVDKSKAEVLVDINIYEVARDELLKIGNQFSTSSVGLGSTSNNNNNNNGGTDGTTNTGNVATQAVQQFTSGLDRVGGFGLISGLVSQNTRMLTGPWGLAIGIPISAISFLQGKDKAKLLASTQVHAVDGEPHTIRIGQRVPIRTATLPTFANTPSTGTPGGVPQQSGFLSGFGVDQIQYENVGLNIDMTPTVFDDEVQVKMKLESSGIGAGADTLTPTFTQRQLSSMARIKDGQTTMIAGVSQKTEHRGYKGLPLVGLVPILGRLFTVPANDNNQSDVVITVTPHILRRADITEEDHLAKDLGPGQSPTRQASIEQILYMADQLDAQQTQVASATTPSGDAQAGKLLATSLETPATGMRASGGGSPSGGQSGTNGSTPGVVVMPPNSNNFNSPGSVQSRQVPSPGANVPREGAAPKEIDDDDDDDDDDTALPGGARPIVVTVQSSMPAAVKGTQFYAAIMLRGDSQISYANLALNYDPTILEVKGVRSTGLMNAGGVNVEPQFTAQGGLLNIVMERPAGTGGARAYGQLLFVIFDVKGQGQTSLSLGEHSVFRAPNGQTIPARFQAAQFESR